MKDHTPVPLPTTGNLRPRIMSAIGPSTVMPVPGP